MKRVWQIISSFAAFCAAMWRESWSWRFWMMGAVVNMYCSFFGAASRAADDPVFWCWWYSLAVSWVGLGTLTIVQDRKQRRFRAAIKAAGERMKFWEAELERIGAEITQAPFWDSTTRERLQRQYSEIYARWSHECKTAKGMLELK